MPHFADSPIVWQAKGLKPSPGTRDPWLEVRSSQYRALCGDLVLAMRLWSDELLQAACCSRDAGTSPLALQ